LKTERKTGAAFPSPFKFQKYGQSGIEVSEIFPTVASCIDDIAVIRSMHADVPNHEPSLLLMNCGEARLIRPSFGSWVTYGLGTDNQNLPGFIAMCPGGYPIQETQNWQSGFLPGVFQGMYIDPKKQNVEAMINDVNQEPQYIRDMYGPGVYAKQVLIARRLLERGVRFIQLYHGEGQPWDNHDDIETGHRSLAKQMDQPVGALLKDLKQRGMLDDT